jgi:hypothetical protein
MRLVVGLGNPVALPALEEVRQLAGSRDPLALPALKRVRPLVGPWDAPALRAGDGKVRPLVDSWDAPAVAALEEVRPLVGLWDPPAVAAPEEVRPSRRQEARAAAPASEAAVRECRFSIPCHRSREISDGGLHDAGAWSWLLDQLYAELGDWFVSFECLRTTDREREFAVTLRAGAFGRLREILEEACERFHRKRIRAVFPGRKKVKEVRHR